jgi:hypothetical protein
MTGIARRGHSLRLVRTSIELSALATGWLLGGTVGIGTVLYAISIGPLVHLLLPRLTIRPGTPPPPSSGARGAGPLPAGGRGQRAAGRSSGSAMVTSSSAPGDGAVSPAQLAAPGGRGRRGHRPA